MEYRKVLETSIQHRVRGNCFITTFWSRRKYPWINEESVEEHIDCWSASFTLAVSAFTCKGRNKKKFRRTQVIDDNKYIPTIMAYAEYVTPNWLANIERIRKPFYPPINCLCETRKIRHSFQIKKTKRMTELKISYFVLGRETSQMSEKTDKTTSFDNVADVTLRQNKCQLSCSS